MRLPRLLFTQSGFYPIYSAIWSEMPIHFGLLQRQVIRNIYKQSHYKWITLLLGLCRDNQDCGMDSFCKVSFPLMHRDVWIKLSNIKHTSLRSPDSKSMAFVSIIPHLSVNVEARALSLINISLSPGFHVDKALWCGPKCGGERPSGGRKCKEKRLHYFRQLSGASIQLALIRLSVWKTKRRYGGRNK